MANNFTEKLKDFLGKTEIPANKNRPIRQKNNELAGAKMQLIRKCGQTATGIGESAQARRMQLIRKWSEAGKIKSRP